MAKGNKKGNNKNQSTKKPQANTKKPQANTKKPQVNNKKRKVEQVEYEELGGIENWDWSEVTAPTNTFMSDDIGGFLCLEEISDVEVEYEGDENTGRVVKFKRVKKDNRKPAKKAQPNLPLSLEETGDFFDIDTYDEESAQKHVKESKESENQVDKMDVDEEKVEENAEEKVEEKEQKPVEKKTKKQKLLEKKKKNLEKLQNEIEKLETLHGDEEESQDDEEEDDKKNKKKQQQKKKNEKKEEAPKKSARPTVADVDQSVDILAWDELNLSEPIRNALKYNQFSSPTPIQKESLPLALDGRDIIGAAETGSGKTLAFGIPMISYLTTHERSGLAGLVLTPTRELAIQVKDHISKMALFTDIRVAAIVGGMSVQKQERLLRNKPDIVVATPGRFWELFSNNDEYMDMLKHIKFLVLDEADRMLEKGHFEELTKLLETFSSKRQDTTEWPEEIEGNTKKVLPQDRGEHQTFIYTATLSKDIRFNVKSKKKKVKTTGTMEDLLSRIEFADSDPALVDMTSENMVASRLLEAKIECVNTDKDLYVYYFVTRYPGRTIIFVNSIDAIRRLVPVFKLLGLEVLGLHAQMQQKQRLKNLDRFKTNDKAVLVASDVAARGLDIPLVEHVIHYQLPRSGEIYVHRSGRTARANRDGISLLLCGPEELKVYRKLCQTLRKSTDYPDFPVDLSILSAMKERVRLAVEVDTIQHQENKQSHETNWMRNMAKEMDIDYDEDTMQVKGRQKSNNELQKDRAKANRLKAELSHLLKQPMLPRGVSKKFITGGVIADLAERMMKSGADSLLPGHATTKAVEDLHSSKKQKTK